MVRVVDFFANTANDAPDSRSLDNPSNGSAVNVYNPVLYVRNSTDLDQDTLTYDFEVYGDAAMTDSRCRGVRSGECGVGSNSLDRFSSRLTENHTYYWRARAFDGTVASEWTARRVHDQYRQ